MISSPTDEIVEVRRKQLRKRLLQSSIISAVSGAIVVLAFIYEAHLSMTRPRTWDPGFGFWGFIGMGGSVSGGAFLVALATSIKLAVGPPKGARSPIKALKKFYSNSLVSKGTIFSKVQAEAMCFLHPNAIASIGGWRRFEEYWNGVNDQIVQHLRSVCKNGCTGTGVEVRSVKPLATSVDDKRFLVTIVFQTKYDKQNALGIVDTYTEGPWIYTAENEMVMEEGHWYLVSAEWAGRPQKNQ